MRKRYVAGEALEAGQIVQLRDGLAFAVLDEDGHPITPLWAPLSNLRDPNVSHQIANLSNKGASQIQNESDSAI